MNPTILNVVRLPARLDTQQAAQLLGFMEHDIPILIRAKLLKPLGSPAKPNCAKYFCASELENLARDRAWLDRASKAAIEHWRLKNERRRSVLIQDEQVLVGHG